MKYKKREELIKENYNLKGEIALLKVGVILLNNLLRKKDRVIKRQNKVIHYVMTVCLAIGLLMALVIFRATI